MRLLQRQGNDSFQLVYRVDEQIPPYAILSHTWGSEEDEVTFKDVVDGTYKKRKGYRKLQFCAKQAAEDGLDFFWIDTCCIDKSSSAELQEAIGCMFRWYRDSAKCYVYLEDVSNDSLMYWDDREHDYSLQFQESRWFTRGWTLQELLAPKDVKFYTKQGGLIGRKSGMVDWIAEITGIPTDALQITPLSHFSIDQRMKWSEGRKTTRQEDLAYSLLGIFDIQMTLYYGEGRERAFERLERKIKKYQDADGSRVQQPEPIALRSDHFGYVLHSSTMLHETDYQYSLLMGNDSNETGKPDLCAVKRGDTNFRNLEVNLLYGAHDYQKFVLRIAIPNLTPLREHWTMAEQINLGSMDFFLADWSGDGTLDLVMIKKSYTGTQVRIFSGADKLQTILFEGEINLGKTDDTWTFGMGKWGEGEKPDLIAIKKSSTVTKTTEVYILKGDDRFRTPKLQTQTALHETDSKWDFVVADWNRDGKPDLVAIKKSETATKCTEVHVLSGASSFQKFSLRAETPLFKSHGLFEFAVADWTRNGKSDLIAFKKRETATGNTEVQVMSQLV
ncbi:HET-domain-containing protein [Alternaria alternata]|nr:HET-domain-containing protein [Alternaria alternata]